MTKFHTILLSMQDTQNTLLRVAEEEDYLKASRSKSKQDDEVARVTSFVYSGPWKRLRKVPLMASNMVAS